jgi:hypothetical protein
VNKQKLRDRIAAVASALAETKAELAMTRKRLDLLVKTSKKK